MREQPLLSDAEWALVIELLERERHELPAEIHHTKTSALRDALRRRRAAVDQLLDRLAGPSRAREAAPDAGGEGPNLRVSGGHG